jgi:hypothetical protein
MKAIISIEQFPIKFIFVQIMVTELKNKISLTQTLIDEAFTTNDTINYNLTLQISVDDILVCVNEKSKNKFIAFEQFQFQHTFNFDLIDALLDEVIKESKLIKYKYAFVNCVLVNNMATLVPSPLFDEDRKKMYLKFNANLEGDELVIVNEIKNLNAKNVFALPFSIKSKIDFLYSKVQYNHYSSILIDNLLAQNKNQNQKIVYVHVQQSHFEIIVIESNNLVFYNTFNHHSAEDLIYYLLFVFEQLQLNPEKEEVYLLGEFEKTGQIYTTLFKYVRTLKISDRKDGADFSYQLQSLPKHSFFTLFNA